MLLTFTALKITNLFVSWNLNKIMYYFNIYFTQNLVTFQPVQTASVLAENKRRAVPTHSSMLSQ